MSQPDARFPAEIRKLAAQLVRDEPALLSSLGFGPYVRQGCGTGPTLLIGDQSEIHLLASRPASRLDHRMALLARPGDMVVVRKREPDFEGYLADYLGLTDLDFIAAPGDGQTPVAAQLRWSDDLLDRCAALAGAQGGLTLTAYITSGNLWRLAQAIGARAQCPVHVNGPSPRTAQRANDKLWFANLARRVIGRDAVPPTLSAYGPAAAAALVARIGRQAGQVIVKIPDSAGSIGNVRLLRDDLGDMPLPTLRRFLIARLHALGWQDIYPLLVGVWDSGVTRSPSAQLWIPLPDDGPPRLQGVFEQSLRGENAAFVGAQRTVLPGGLHQRFATEALRIADVLQRSGYFGRCSFDAVICDDGSGQDVIHWIECNARWGGVSIPMTALHRIAAGSETRALLIMQETLMRKPVPTAAIVTLLDDLMFRAGRTDAGLVMMSPPPQQADGLPLNLAAMAGSEDDAARMMQTAIARILAAPDA